MSVYRTIGPLVLNKTQGPAEKKTFFMIYANNKAGLISIFFCLLPRYVHVLYEPRCEKTGFFAYAKTKTLISFAVTAKLIKAFVFATLIVQSLYFLNPKFLASNHLLWLYSPLCFGPVRNPEDRFCHDKAHIDNMDVPKYQTSLCDCYDSCQGRIQDFWKGGSNLPRGVRFIKFSQFLYKLAMKMK